MENQKKRDWTLPCCIVGEPQRKSWYLWPGGGTTVSDHLDIWLYIYISILYIYIYFFFLSSLPVHIYKDIWLHFLYMISLSMLCVVRWRGLIIRYVGWITTLYLLLFLLLPGCFCCWPYGIYIFFCVTWGRMEEEGNVRAVVVVGGGGGEKATPEKASLGPLAVGPTPFFFANQ